MKWEPHDVIRLSALLGAIALFVLGAAMMWQGIAAEGSIDLKSSIVSGSIKTGSAGLFICFMSFVVMVFVLAGTHKQQSTVATVNADRSRFKRILPVFLTLLAVLVGSILLASSGYPGFAFLAFLCGFLLFVVVVAALTFLEEER
jgi:hypothetical protein